MNTPLDNMNNISNFSNINNLQLESLHVLEDNVLKIGKEIGNLFNAIEKSLETNDIDNNSNNFEFENVLNLITTTRENLHKKVDELYSKKSFFYMNQLDNDIQEKELQKKQINDFILPPTKK